MYNTPPTSLLVWRIGKIPLFNQKMFWRSLCCCNFVIYLLPSLVDKLSDHTKVNCQCYYFCEEELIVSQYNRSDKRNIDLWSYIPVEPILYFPWWKYEINNVLSLCLFNFCWALDGSWSWILKQFNLKQFTDLRVSIRINWWIRLIPYGFLARKFLGHDKWY